MQVVVAAEHEVPEHARVSLCRQAQQATSLSDDELEYASASSPAQVAARWARAWFHTLANVNKALSMPVVVLPDSRGLRAKAKCFLMLSRLAAEAWATAQEAQRRTSRG